MIKLDENTKGGWELEINCQNREYLNKTISSILKYGYLNFEVEVLECHGNIDEWEGSYLILIWGYGFDNLSKISKDLSKIQKKLGI